MALDADDEILQDFLVEASELLEQLNEQLVELEQRPDDRDLLNAIFRGFHTIKGGAGFLNLNALVEVCHRSEDIFNLLRNGEKVLTTEMMDTFLKVLDLLNNQFDHLRALQDPPSAEAWLLHALETMNRRDADEPPKVAPTPAVAATEEEAVLPHEVEAPPMADAFDSALIDREDSSAEEDILAAATGADLQGDITDEEFEALLDALERPAASAANPAPARPAETPLPPPGDGDEITEEEFESFLDQMYGKGKFGEVAAPPPEPAAAAPAVTPTRSRSEAGATADEDISEEEFEALLDQMYGRGKFGSTEAAAPAAAPPSAAPPVVPAPATPPAKAPPPPPAAAARPLRPADAGQATGGGASSPPPIDRPPPPARAQPAGDGDAKKQESQAETTVRVDTKRLDDIMNMVGELVLVRNRLSTLASFDSKQGLNREEMGKAIANLDVVTGDLQMAVMKTRMQPIKKVFGRFPRVVRDLARSLNKDVQLVLQGEETDLDKNLVEALADPLVHLVRNAVDHGVEMPDDRIAKGKSRTGTVKLSAEQEGDHILLVIEDDGAGMDPDKLRRLAVKKGLLDDDGASRLDDKEAFMLIFAPGFSTKTEITDISGRGVGMDVVKTRIAQLNGNIDIHSELNKGTKLSIKVPLTLAIMPTLMVKLGEQTFALPLASVNEIFHLDLRRTNIVNGQRIVMIRQKALPLYYLTSWLIEERRGDPLPDWGHIVVVHIGNQMIGFVVDQLIGQEEVVIKPLGALLQGTQGMSGATITGDGKIALILDVPSLMKAYA
jgi:two-component system, chemotaxis family, sensor kinase CheA